MTIGFIFVGAVVVFIKSDSSLIKSSWQKLNSTAASSNKSELEDDFGRDSMQVDISTVENWLISFVSSERYLSLKTSLSDLLCEERVLVPHDKYILYSGENNCTENDKIGVNEETKLRDDDEHPCNLYGLLWLGNNTCYRTIESIMQRDWHISMLNKTSAVEVCERNNSTLPYSELG